MTSQALEQMLDCVPIFRQTKIYETIDVYTRETIALYTAPPKPNKPIIYDMPSIGGQLHLHENELGISGGRLYPYDRSIFKPINAYEGAMLDYYAKELGIDKK